MSESTSDRDPLELLAESFIERFRAGEQPAVEEYVARYPELADELRPIFLALVTLEAHAQRIKLVELPGANDSPIADLGQAGLQSSPNDDDLPSIAGYQIRRIIGRGGMGVVYEAEQQPLGRMVALKILPAGLWTDATRRERFRQESRAAAKLHHAHIVPIFDVGEADGHNYYTMQYIRGPSLDLVWRELRRQQNSASDPREEAIVEDLSSRIRALSASHQLRTGTPVSIAEMNTPRKVGDRTPADSTLASQSLTNDVVTSSQHGLISTNHSYYLRVAKIGAQIADALAHAHSEGILHRDIKPSNIILDPRGEAWLTDFGLAKVEGDAPITETGDVVGTLRFLAPERLEGWSDPRGDIYALGATLYELLTLRYVHTASQRGQMLERILHHEPIPPRRIDARIPPDLETIVLKALSKDPSARYTSAARMAEDLTRFQQGVPVLARRISTTERAYRWCRRNRAVASLGLATLVSLTAAVAILASGNRTIKNGNRALTAAITDRDVALHKSKKQEGETQAALRAETDARRQARSALDTLTDNVVQRLLTEKPKLNEEDKSFLKKVAELYGSVSPAESPTTESLLVKGNSYRRLGDIHLALGNFTEAQRVLLLAEKALEAINPKSLDARKILTAVRVSLYMRLSSRSIKEADVTAIRKLISEQEQLVAELPDDDELRHSLAATCLNLVLKDPPRPGNLDECEALLDKAQAQLEIVTAKPDCPTQSLLYLSSCYNNMGAVLQIRNDLPGAESQLKRALEIRKRLAEKHPNDVEAQGYLGRAVINLAKLQVTTGKTSEAMDNYRKGLDIKTKLVGDFPGRPAERLELMSDLDGFGLFLLSIDQPAEAIREFDRALEFSNFEPSSDRHAKQLTSLRFELHKNRATALDRIERTADADTAWAQLIESVPGNARSELQVLRAYGLAKAGHHQRATQLANSVTNLSRKGGDLYNCACAFALSSAAAHENSELQNSYASRAIELLRQAFESREIQPDEIEHLKNDPDLTCLRQRIDYQELVANLEKIIRDNK